MRPEPNISMKRKILIGGGPKWNYDHCTPFDEDKEQRMNWIVNGRSQRCTVSLTRIICIAYNGIGKNNKNKRAQHQFNGKPTKKKKETNYNSQQHNRFTVEVVYCSAPVYIATIRMSMVDATHLNARIDRSLWFAYAKIVDVHRNVRARAFVCVCVSV